jgi:hypothetical protein
MTIKKVLVAVAATALAVASQAQGIMGGHVTGNVQADAQMSRADSTIGAREVEERLLLNTRADILYQNGGFSAGLRFEMYHNPLLGFDAEWKGQGLAHYFVAYNSERLSVTVGHFYEQFGSGLILRSYEDRYLGLDNAIFGLNVALRPWQGVTVKALAGKQRHYWGLGDGLVRGVDAEVNLAEAVRPLQGGKLRAIVGAGFVSKYEADAMILADQPGYRLKLPLNVGAGAVRAELGWGGWSLQAEYARKGQDPSVVNDYTYREGEALTATLAYSQRGFSATLQAKRVENMAFKSMRTIPGQQLYINYLPAITKNHTYAFLTMYPYATNVMGEQGLQGDVMWKVKKDTWLGGKYGMDIRFNSAVVCGLDTTRTGGAGTDGYRVNRGPGPLLFGEASVEVARKLSKTVKLTLTYAYQAFNPVVEGELPGLYHNNIVVADATWRVSKQHTLRFEGEWMGSDSRRDASAGHTDPRLGDWLMGLVEWSIGSHWFVSLSDQWAYNDGQGNYYNISAGYTHGATRLQLGYGKQRRGMLCIGGVCREVPASNGLTLSLTTSF